MMNFNFKLEKVLKYKKTIENYKKNQYGTVQRRLNNEEDKLRTFNQYKNNLKNEKNLSATKTKVGDLMMYNNYINHVATKIKFQEEVITETKEELEEVKEELIIALKEKKIFEKLKENEYKEYLYQLKKQEEKQIDTLVSYKTSAHQ